MKQREETHLDLDRIESKPKYGKNYSANALLIKQSKTKYTTKYKPIKTIFKNTARINRLRIRHQNV